MEATLGSLDTCSIKSLRVKWDPNGCEFLLGKEKIFDNFSKVIYPEKLQHVWRHPRIVEIQVYPNYDPLEKDMV